MLAACADTPKVRATSAWLAPWANMRAASRRRCSRPAKSRRQVPTLIGIPDLHVRCPCLHTQHASPNYAYQPIQRSSLSTGAAYVLNYRLIADEGATVASTVTYLIPIVALLLGAIVLGEPLTWNLFIGAAIVLA